MLTFMTPSKASALKQFADVPSELRALNHFVIWRKGPTKANAKFDKIPLAPSTLKAGNAHAPENWLTFDEAVDAFTRGDCEGIGLALKGQPDQEGRYLTCVDLDAAVTTEEAMAIHERLGKPWMERSPSGMGWHLWMWSREPLKSGNAGGGRELYQARQFVTLTGWEPRGEMCDSTDELQVLNAEWFGHRERGADEVLAGAARGIDATTQALLNSSPPPETPSEIERVRSMLAAIGADCHRDMWRDSIWALLSTGWSCAEQMAREWSESCPEKFVEEDLETLFRDYRHGRMGFGKLVNNAKAAVYSQQGGMPPDLSSTHGDIRNARKFAEHWRGRLLHISSRNVWHRWEDGRWQLCQKGEQMNAAKDIAAQLVQEAKAVLSVDPAGGRQHMNHAVASHNLGRLEAMLRLAQSEGGMSATEVELDADPRLLGVANGVVDLRTGKLRENRPEDYITRYCSASYEPGAQCRRWQQFLDEIFQGDAETVNAVQTLLGYTLTALNTEEIMVVAYGHGANGKSVFGNLIHSIMGGYSTVAASSLLVARAANDTGPRDDLAALAGARHVSINELQSGDRLDERVVKVLAGREPISARYLYGSHFSYQPAFTAWLRTNHKPIIHGTDEGIWRRLVLLPFKRQFAPHERDASLEEKLDAERDGILTWMVAGAVRYLSEGLRLSPAMKVELNAY